MHDLAAAGGLAELLNSKSRNAQFWVTVRDGPRLALAIGDYAVTGRAVRATATLHASQSKAIGSAVPLYWSGQLELQLELDQDDNFLSGTLTKK